jgi:hypothetical protein
MHFGTIAGLLLALALVLQVDTDRSTSGPQPRPKQAGLGELRLYAQDLFSMECARIACELLRDLGRGTYNPVKADSLRLALWGWGAEDVPSVVEG